MTLQVASLHVYPIKSLGGFELRDACITDRGFEHDRRWMLVDGNGTFITQREVAAMTSLHCSPRADGMRVTDILDGDHLDLPWSIHEGATGTAQIWKHQVQVLHAPMEVSAWFAGKLGITCSLVFMPDISHRKIDPAFAQGLTTFTDGFPYLMISQSSLADLNKRMAHPLPMDRFRPSIVIAGGEAYQEDGWKEISIGDARLRMVKPCSRCVITTTDQETGARGKEPLRTLATYRRAGNEVNFGMNAVALGGSVVRVGDLVAQ